PFFHSFFFQAADGIRDFHVTGVQTVLFRSGRTKYLVSRIETTDRCRGGSGHSGRADLHAYLWLSRQQRGHCSVAAAPLGTARRHHRAQCQQGIAGDSGHHQRDQQCPSCLRPWHSCAEGNRFLVPSILTRLLPAYLLPAYIGLCAAMWLPQAWSQSVTVTDDNGREIHLQQPAGRIISLAPSMTELLFAAGAGDRLVGVSEYSDYPPQALDIEIIGRFDMINTEAILALQPDLIVAWRSGNPQAAVQRLIDLGLNVYVGEPATLESIPSHLQRLAALAGTENIGNAAAQDLRQRLSTMAERYRDATP